MRPDGFPARPGRELQPEISVIVPAYQSAWSIERTIRSVLNQRFDNFEVIIIDDGSTDYLHERIDHLVAGDHRVRLIHQSNRGLAAARNRGIEEARAPLVAPIDADDLWHPDFLLACEAALDAAPDAPFAFAHSFRIDEHDVLYPFDQAASALRHDFAGLLSFNSVSNGSAALFRKDAVIAAGRYDEALGARGLHGAEDYKLILRLARRAPPVLVERHLVAYRRVLGGMSLGDPGRQLRACLAVLDDLRAENPAVPASLFRDARTSLVGWLLPYFLLRGDPRGFLAAFARGYLAHPLWFLNRTVRRVHVRGVANLLRSAFDRIRYKEADRPHLADVDFAGEHPFDFLEQMRSEETAPRVASSEPSMAV